MAGILAVVISRFYLIYSERKFARLNERWTPIFEQAIVDRTFPDPLPPVGDYDYVVELWTKYTIPVQAKHRESMIELARKTGLVQHARYVSETGSGSRHFSAMLMLGHVHDETSVDTLSQFFETLNPYRCIVALMAVAQIEPELAVEKLIQRELEKGDLPDSLCIEILDRMDQDILKKHILDPCVEEDDEDRKETLLNLMGPVSLVEHPDLLIDLLKSATHPGIIASVLRLIESRGDPADESHLWPFLNHDTSFIRTRASQALGAIGTSQSFDRLVEALSDSSWWVRLRSAEAIASLPDVSRQQLETLAKNHDDRYARDVLNQVLTA